MPGNPATVALAQLVCEVSLCLLPVIFFYPSSFLMQDALHFGAMTTDLLTILQFWLLRCYASLIAND